MTEQFSPEERAALSPYFTNLDGPVFALVSLPEVVKGALFARYSRSPKSLRRLFLDEFLADVGRIANVGEPLNFVKTSRAEELYGRMFFEYGDDSVAQLGGVHLACEGASNILTKVLEWGRLAAYLEQSTRYVPYDDLVGGRYRYHVPRELDGELRARYLTTLDAMFDTYRELLPILRQHFTERFPKDEQTSDGAYRMSIRAKALDTLRGLLPAATTSNVGIYGTGQAYENLLLRMRAHPLLEVRAYAGLMLEELRKVIPAFLRRVDLPNRGGAWSDYLEDTRRSTSRVAAALVADESELSRDEVTLTDFDPDGETKVVAAALYAVSNVPDDRLLEIAHKMTEAERRSVLEAYVGRRTNRRQKPGRAFERTSYRFDVLADYGAFRDLQRHRLLTLEWQRLSPRHGFVMPEAVAEARVEERWRRSLEASAALHDAIAATGLTEVAPYAVAMAYRVRFYMDMNAREAMHLIELRSAPQGHPAYRRISQTMHRLIAERAGHRALAAAMTFADHSEVALERLEAERAAERRRGQERS
jgi:thymidylate synthase ThyX